VPTRDARISEKTRISKARAAAPGKFVKQGDGTASPKKPAAPAE